MTGTEQSEGTLRDIDEVARRIEVLVEELGPEAGELASALMQLYGAGLARIVEALRGDAPEILDRLAADKVVASLLLLHDLHPVDLESRLRTALDRVERGLEWHRLIVSGIEQGIARIRVEGSGRVPAHLAQTIERALVESIPDLAGVEIEGIPSSLVQIAPVNT
ncbi:MAG TPA: hypothetical protein VFW83_05860 [Bryobacteraceae bacterium]|nr:hypothetical protein [Bryobacteraceae bacterium]